MSAAAVGVVGGGEEGTGVGVDDVLGVEVDDVLGVGVEVEVEVDVIVGDTLDTTSAVTDEASRPRAEG